MRADRADGAPVADRYPNFAALKAGEPAHGYAVRICDRGSAVVIVAPHGGAIEPGTSEVACAIAGEDLSYYMFEGQKPRNNFDLHLTSSNFDEPSCLALLGAAERVVTVHGEASREAVVYIGGRDRQLRAALAVALAGHGFAVASHTSPRMQGSHARNICNLGRAGAGVQLELAGGLRRRLLGPRSAPSKERAARIACFAAAVRQVLCADGL